MSAERVKCIECDRMILPDTAERNDGLCAPCAKGDDFLDMSNWEKEMKELSAKVLEEHPEYLEDLHAGIKPYQEGDLGRNLSEPINYSTLKFVPEYRSMIAAEAFYPIGIRNAYPSEIDVICRGFDQSSGSIDLTKLPTKELLLDSVKEAFAQYCSDEWCGAEMREEVLEELQEPLSYPEGEEKCFIENGYYPYFLIQALTVDLERNAIVLDGSVECDFNLSEHGVSILIENGVVKFGYGAEHEECEDF